MVSGNISSPGKVAILCGGMSSERSVSLSSGKAVYDALNRIGSDVYLLDTAQDMLGQLLCRMPDKVFILLHGIGGEDGTVQGLLECCQIPYTGSGVMASALAMDKYRSKLLWRSVSLPTPDFKFVHCEEDLARCDSLLPAFLKPNKEGSSIGVIRVVNAEKLVEYWKEAAKYGDGTVLVEKAIVGSEFTVCILNGQVLPVIRVESSHEFYDYRSKYVSGDTRYISPCGLTEESEYKLQTLALTAFETLGCSGWGRVDVMQDTNGCFWLLEVNTIPGMTETSLLPMVAKSAGLSFEELVLEILYGSNTDTIKKKHSIQEAQCI